jgi:hypothetical protein
MAKTNLQIRVSEEIVNQIGKVSEKSKSEFVREAIEEKIRREMDRKRVEKWIEALKKKPEDVKEAENWLKAESWGPR